MESILANQNQVIEAIQSLERNFKKDGAERKTQEKIKRRIETLDLYWSEFQNNHEKLSQSLDEKHDYFTGNYYEKMKKFYYETRDLFQKTSLVKPATLIASPNVVDMGDSRSASPYVSKQEEPRPGTSSAPQKFSSRGSNSKMDEMMKKQMSNFKAFSRTISQICIEDIKDKWEFEDTLNALKSRWHVIDKLHWEIDGDLDESDDQYEEMFSEYERRYHAVKKALNLKLWSVAHREKCTPQLDIPVFSGNYQQWVSFKDLYCEAVHNNPSLSDAQKMQFLKSKLRGEAERLVQHLTIGTENYLACWEIINHRYNNKKMIFTSYINTLMSIPATQQASSSHVKRVHDVTKECLNAIRNLGVNIDTWDPIVVHILSQKLDAETHKEYLNTLKDPRELPLVSDFLDFLENKFTNMESLRRKQDNMNEKSSSGNPSSYGKPKQEISSHFKQHPSSNRMISSQIIRNNKFNNCLVCDSNEHGIYYCKRFLEMPSLQKRQFINANNLCTNCLYSHKGKPCTSNKRCRNCNGSHNTVLHDIFTKSNYTTQHVTSMPMNSTDEPNHSTMNSHVTRKQEEIEVLLATALIKVEGVDGVLHVMRALIDQGSQISIITENAAQRLGLPRQRYNGVVTGIGSKDNTCKGKLNLNCMAVAQNFSFETEAYIMKKLTRNLPSFTFSKPVWNYLDNIQLADPEFYISRPIDILLSADVYSNIVMQGLRRADYIRPVAQQTQLGWILYGKTQTLQCNVTLNGIQDIQRFWEIEDIAESSSYSAEDVKCMDFYKATTTRVENGRYQVRLPLKSNVKEIGESRKRATAQLLQLERKFYKNNKIANDYKMFMTEYQDLGHMKQSNKNSTVEYFLPHHCVTRESTTTSLRVVFNASQNTTNGKSLNDYMYKGPNLQKDLSDLILKWRVYRIAFTADIEKMFRQILVHQDDRKYQKILWRNSPRDVIREYELTTVTYGTKAAPFLAMMTLRQLASDERHTYPEAAQVVETSYYTDDLVHGSHDISAALKLKQDLIQLLQFGGFNLRKWTSNCQELIQDSQDFQEQDSYNFKEMTSTKTLGLHWNPKQDTFYFQSMFDNPTTNEHVTKRKLLSEISKLFDPLGWLTPVSIKMKLLFQKIWEVNIHWDDKIPEDIFSEWEKIRRDIININEIKLPRWINTSADTDIEVHGFSDASQKAYACVIYCKLTNNQNSEPKLLVAKSRLIPRNKDISLPKLELSGAYLLSKLMQKTMQCLSNYNIKVYGWIDSTAVLGWIQGHPDRWRTFVSNRVRKITQVIPPNCWRYVKSAENPADCASRGITATQLKEHKLWWQGPSWLPTYQDENQEKEIFTTNEELKNTKQVFTVSQDKQKDKDIIKDLLNRYSSLTKAVRVLAWTRRFLARKEERKQESYLTLSELQQAKTMIIKQVQADNFREELSCIVSNKKIPTRSKILCLTPYMDQQGVLRVGGRLQHAHISPEMKNPIILPYDSRLTELIIEDAHKLTFHGGSRVTLAFIRRKYWLISGNRATKKYIKRCVTCRKHNSTKQTQIMGDLPAARINQSRPFLHTGVDFTGHVFIKANKGRGIKTVKGYVAVFVCMVTKAVHLELVSDMTTSAFIAALRRMAARRGKPSHMFSDNGKNFVGASRVLQQEYQEIEQVFNEEFRKDITDMEITWHFNAPSWPSAGGLFEAAVKSFKYHMKRVIGEQKLTYEEFYTILAQIEAVLNSRPLCALSEDPDDLNFLTPAHFLTGGPLLTIIETERDMRTRWQLTQRIFQDIWKRWRSEYLTQLSSKSKWRHPSKNVNINDVVLIQEDNLPPGKWLMGRIVELHPGQDGYVRVVTLKTKTGYLKRPVTKISILSQQEDNVQEPHREPEQRRKSNKRFNLTSLFTTCLLFLTLITSSECLVNISKFRDNQGVYFDKLSDMRLIKDEWKVIVYYDLEPYWQGNQALKSYISELEDESNSIQNKMICTAVILQLRHGYNELEYYNQLLMNQPVYPVSHSATQRKRRGLTVNVRRSYYNTTNNSCL